MAILLVVLPNSTISDPSKPKTCPTLGWNHLADAPYRLSLGKAALHFHTGCSEAQVRTEAFAVRQSSRPGAAPRAPAGAGGSPVGGGRSCAAGQGLSFLLNYMILSGMFICLFFFFSTLVGVLGCATVLFLLSQQV